MITSLKPPQRVFLDAVQSGKYKLTLWIGSVRTGKTVGMTLALYDLIATHVAMNQAGYYFIVCGTLMQLNRIYDDAMMQVSQTLGVPCTIMGGDNPRYELNVGGRHVVVYKLSANDTRSSSRIMGMTLHSGIIDEITLLNEDFVERIMTRLSYDNSFVMMGGNADSPYNFVRRKYILNPNPNLFYIETKLKDDVGFSETRKELLLDGEDVSGHRYKRLVENQWAPAEGVCYPINSDMIVHRTRIPDPRYYVAMDWGLSGTTAALLFGQWTLGKWHIYEEYYSTGEHLSDDEHLDRIVGMWGTPRGMIVDPSAASMKHTVVRRGIKLIPTDNTVVAGIDTVNNRLASGQLTIDSKCERLLEEASAYVYNPKTEMPVKTKDHACDAMRYGVMSLIGNNSIGQVVESKWATEHDPYSKYMRG